MNRSKPLILSFLGRVFVDENVRSILFAALAERLEEALFVLNEQLGEDTFPRSGKAYLDDWSAPSGQLRRETVLMVMRATSSR